MGESQACQQDETYCIKELSGKFIVLSHKSGSITLYVAGDDSNRELVARKCGNEFDKYLACGSGGDNIGIAASGDVICCNNR